MHNDVFCSMRVTASDTWSKAHQANYITENLMLLETDPSGFFECFPTQNVLASSYWAINKVRIYTVETHLVTCLKRSRSFHLQRRWYSVSEKGIAYWLSSKGSQSGKADIVKHSENLTNRVFFQQDNAPPHKSLVSMAAERDRGFQLIDHPPYSPDLSPSDSHLLRNVTKPLSWEAVSPWWWCHICRWWFLLF